jgi:hypothetical protein
MLHHAKVHTACCVSIATSKVRRRTLGCVTSRARFKIIRCEFNTLILRDGWLSVKPLPLIITLQSCLCKIHFAISTGAKFLFIPSFHV